MARSQDELESMVLSLSVDTRTVLRTLKKFGADVDATADGAARAFVKPTDQFERMGKAMSKSQVQTANLAAQFNDIAVQLQGGQSPFQIALQQGTQITQALGPQKGGLKGVVGALGSAFLSMVNPVSLATIALIALGGAGVQYLTKMLGETEDLDDKLKAHKEIISSIQGAYGDALKGVDLYAKQSTSVLEAQARAAAAGLAEALKSETQKALKASGSFFIDPNDIIGDKESFQVKARFAAFSDAILALRQSAQEGAPDIRAFRIAVAEIANADPSNKKLQDLAAELLAVTSEAGKVDDALIAAQRAIAATASVASGSVQAIKEYRDALTDLSKVALPNLSPRQQADAAYARAVSSATTPGARAAADTEYLAALDRIDAAEKELEDKRAKREAEAAGRRAARKSEREQERIDNVIKGLQTEADNIGRAAREQAIYNAVAAAGVDINSQYGQQIAGLAGHLYDLEEAQNAAIHAMDTLRAGASDVLSGFVSDMRNGVSATQALSNALNKVADKLIDISLNSILDSALGKSGTAGGGFLSSLFSSFGGLFASGGTLGAGKWGIAGEAGPEIISGPARITPMQKTGGGALTATISIDLSGANGDAAIEDAARRAAAAGAALALRQVPSLAVQAVQNHQIRFG